MIRSLAVRARRRVGVGFFPLLAAIAIVMQLQGGVVKAEDHEDEEFGGKWCSMCNCCLFAMCPQRCGAVCGLFACLGHGYGSHSGVCDNGM